MQAAGNRKLPGGFALSQFQIFAARRNEMKGRPARKGWILPLRGNRMWVLFAVLLVAMASAAVFGTGSVQASACTTAQCNSSYWYANDYCTQHGSVLVYFQCPFSQANDDFVFMCSGIVAQIRDCATHGFS
jgi:hypothetical protein